MPTKPDQNPEAVFPSPSAGSSMPLTAEQVSRWAKVIADDRSAIPNDLPEADRKRLEAAVRVCLRHRLMLYVARVIAADLYSRHSNEPKELLHEHE